MLDALTMRWNAFSGIGEQRALAPFEDVALLLAFLPDFGRAAAFDHEHDLLVEMPLDIERARTRHLDDVHPPQALGAVELDVRAAPAEPLPRRHREIVHARDADAAIDRHAFGFHEAVVGQLRPLERAEAGVFAGLRFMPVRCGRRVVHGYITLPTASPAVAGVELRQHPVLDAVLLQRLGELGADRGIFLVIRNRAAALLEIDRAEIELHFAGHAGFARALIVRAVPGGDAQAAFADAEMLMEPVAAHRRRRHHAAELVVLALDLVLVAVPPGLRAERRRPGVGVARALDADQHRGRRVLVRLRVAPGLVMADPEIEAVARHRRLHAAVAGRAPVIQRQFRVDDVGDEIRAPHGEAAHRIGLEIVVGLEVVRSAREPLGEFVRAVEDELAAVEQVHHVGRRGAADDERARRRRIDDAVIAVERNGEDRALLPFEHVALGLAFLPHFGRAAAFDDEADLLVEMAFGVERARAGQLDHIHAPQAFGAEELDEGAAAAQALPVGERQVLHAPDADVAIHGQAFLIHEAVIGQLRPFEGSEACVLARFRFVPMRAGHGVVHRCSPECVCETPIAPGGGRATCAGRRRRQGPGSDCSTSPIIWDYGERQQPRTDASGRRPDRGERRPGHAGRLMARARPHALDALSLSQDPLRCRSHHLVPRRRLRARPAYRRARLQDAQPRSADHRQPAGDERARRRRYRASRCSAGAIATRCCACIRSAARRASSAPMNAGLRGRCSGAPRRASSWPICRHA